MSNYIKNRDALLNEWSSTINHTKDEIKTIFLSALNGNNTKYNLPHWNDILNEFKEIHRSIVVLPEYSMILKEVEDVERTNINAKVVNRILCQIENSCLESLYVNLDKRGLLNLVIDNCNYKCCSLIFDGLQIPLNDMTKTFCISDNFKVMSSIIQNETGYYLDIVQKPFEEFLELPTNIEDDEDDDEIVIEDDGDAAEHIISKYSNLMVSSEQVKYIKNGNIWTCDERVIKSIVYGWIFKSPIKKTIGDKTIFYNRDKTSINKCIDIIMENWANFIPNTPSFVESNQIKSKEYLPFTNGVYSMRHKKLMNYDEVPCQFTQMIDRDFPVYNKDSFDTLMEKVIIPILPDVEEREYFIYCIARALAGKYEDKKWFINKGSRNSGKGVITKLLQNAFKIFVGTFNSGALTRKQNENADDAKNLSWVVKKKDCRLLISNEVQEDVILNGKMLKQLASGGDTMLGRCNYQDETEFTPQFTMMLQLNNLKGVEPVDALESCEQFYCKSKFVSEEDLIEGQPFLKLRDDTIKMLLEKPEIIDAFTIYVLNHFQDSMETPDSVKFSTEEMVSDIPLSLEEIVLKHFRYSDSDTDRLFTEDIINNIEDKTDYEGSVGTKELQSIILKCGVGRRNNNGKITINGKKQSGYTNIVFINPIVRDFNHE